MSGRRDAAAARTTVLEIGLGTVTAASAERLASSGSLGGEGERRRLRGRRGSAASLCLCVEEIVGSVSRLTVGLSFGPLIVLATMVLVLGASRGPGLGLSGSTGQRVHFPLPGFVERALGRPASAESMVRRSASGVVVVLSADGFRYTAGAGEVVGLRSVGKVGRAIRFQNGVAAPTRFGDEVVTVRGDRAEQLVTVRRRLGERTWTWRLDASLRARVGGGGSVGFFDPETHELSSIVIPPPRVFDDAGRDVTPPGLGWSVEKDGGRQFLSLSLDDARLPLPYTIDPIATRSSATGSGTSGLTLTVPSTVETGDLIVVHVAVVGGTGDSSISPSISGGGGSFTTLSSQNNAGTALAQETFWKRAASTDASATITVTWSPTSKAGAAEVVVLEGVATNGTIPQTSSGASSSSTSASKNISCPAILSSHFPDNNMGLCLGSINKGNSWPATASSWTKITSKANGLSVSVGSYSDLCSTSGGCSVSATNIATTGSNGSGELGNDFDVSPDTTAPASDSIGLIYGTDPGVQSFNTGTNTYYFGVIPGSTTFQFQAAPIDSGSGIDHVAFPDVSSTTGWSGDTGGTVNYQASGSYTSATYTITTSPNAPAAANITATDNNSNSLATPITFVHDTTPPPTPSAPTLTGGYYTAASVSVTGTDTTDTGSGTNAAASTMLRASASLNSNGSCGGFGSFSAISGWTSGVAHSDTTVSNGHCYEYKWQDADNVGNVATSAASAAAKVESVGPTLATATVSGGQITLIYTSHLNLKTTAPAASAYTVHINGGTGIAPSAVSIQASDWVVLLLPSAVRESDSVTLDYTAPGSSPVQDLAGNAAANLSGQAITNESANPLLISSRVGNGTSLTVGFNEQLLGGQTPQPGDFAVVANGSSVTVSSVSTITSGALNLVLTLASPLTSGETVTLQYTKNANPADQIEDFDALNTLPSESSAQPVANVTGYSPIEPTATAANWLDGSDYGAVSRRRTAPSPSGD